MDPQRFHRMAAVFEAAWRAPAAERAAYLEQACDGDDELRARVDSLLLHYEKSGDPLRSDWLAEAAAHSGLHSELGPLLAGIPPKPGRLAAPPDVIDRYQLHECLGEGGFGQVYRARQTAPVVRDVALKLIKPGMDSRQIVARFEAERQALALMEHPGIARVFDAGASSDGRPYFVMELVRGVPITQYARDQRLGVRERLELFIQVCHAVQHAHQKGIIHRDLKPSNILVVADEAGAQARDGAALPAESTRPSPHTAAPSSPRASPKIIDFGIAKATQQPLTEHTLETLAGQLMGTPAYMSPEQVDLRAVDIDTRSDIYALGVVLYELLSGTLPFDVAAISRGGLPELLRTIRDVEPPPPGAHAPAVRGELDWIVLKCLEKDRARRYQSASALADDIERYLRDEPVTARSQTTWYRTQKFIRRNRVLVGALGAIFLALTLGVAATSWQALRAARERDHAAEQALRARETAALLTRVIQSANPEFARGTNPTVREMLDAASRDLEADHSLHPLVAGDAHATFAAAYMSLADYARSLTHARRAIAVRSAELGPQHADTLAATDTLIRALACLDQDAEAVQTARTAVEAARTKLGPDHPVAIQLAITLAFALSNVVGVDRTEVLRWSREAYERSIAAYGRDDPRSLHATSDFALELMHTDQLDEAERLQRQILDTRRRTLAPDHPLLLTSMCNVLAVLDRRNDSAAARELGAQIVAIAERVLGPDDPRTGRYLLDLAKCDVFLNRPSDAEVSARRATAISAARLGPAHPQALDCRGLLANILIQLKRPDDAAPLTHEQYEVCQKEYGPRHNHTIRAITLEYDLAQARGDIPEMRRWAEALRGTPIEDAAFEQLRAAEAAASQPATAPQ